MLFRNHPVSPYIQFKVRLLQMDVVKSDRVYIQYTTPDDTKPDKVRKDALYVHAEKAYTYMLNHCKVHFEAYYPGKEYTLVHFKIVDFRNTNRFRSLCGK